MSLSPIFRVTVLLILFNELCVSDAKVLEYADIKTTGMSCFPKDSCDRNIELPFGNRSCECDTACDKFNDCCIDAPSNRRRSQNSDTEIATDFECLADESGMGIYAIMKCPTDYQGPEEVRSKCENEDVSDRLNLPIVTDIAFNITYNNRYCAECHNAEVNNLRTWDPAGDCDYPYKTDGKILVDEKYVIEHFTFVNDSSDSSDGNWGFYYPADEQSAERKFYACYFWFNLPDSLLPLVRFCRDDIISTCPQIYRRSEIIKACKSYTAMVEIAGKIYKNPHCAMCNSENIRDVNKQTICSIALNHLQKRDRREGLPFAVLMDVNTSDGEMVGFVRDDRCPGTAMWDPFAKRCRRTICAIPTWRVEFGKCVPP